MQTRTPVRAARRCAAGLAACLATAATAYAGAGAVVQAAPTAGVTISGAGDHQTLRYGRAIGVTVRGGAAAAGRVVRLEHAPRGAPWRAVRAARTDAGGSYRFRVRVRRSGGYRAVVEGSGTSETRRVTVVAFLAARATRHVRLGSRVRVRGVLRARRPGRRVRLQLRTVRGWRTVDGTRTGHGGRFIAGWRATRAGRVRLRLTFAGDRLNAAARRTLRGSVYVYRPARASWYGPGFYGRRTGCGRRLEPSMLGVAHRRLPCGTPVRLRYGGRSVTVPVIDRGPYAGGREFDLTGATKRRLAFPSTGTVWTTR